MATEKSLQDQVREAFAATGPAALEKLITAMADRITELEAAVLAAPPATATE